MDVLDALINSHYGQDQKHDIANLRHYVPDGAWFPATEGSAVLPIPAGVVDGGTTLVEVISNIQARITKNTERLASAKDTEIQRQLKNDIRYHLALAKDAKRLLDKYWSCYWSQSNNEDMYLRFLDGQTLTEMMTDLETQGAAACRAKIGHAPGVLSIGSNYFEQKTGRRMTYSEMRSMFG